MTATLKVIRRVVVESGNANLLDWGDVQSAMQDTACAGVPIARPTTIVLAAGASVKIWDFTADGAFVLFGIECSGYAWLAVKVDAPVSGSDPTAAGTAVNYEKTGLSCVAPHYIEGMANPVVPSASNHASAAFHGTTADGRMYEIWLKNPSSTDAITATFFWTL